jgi:regulator of protease activity HflC (stomatin/prohibitin superfamily)
MGLILLGILALIIGITTKRDALPLGNFKGILTSVGVILIIVGGLTKAIKTIDAGEVGVIKLFGEVQEDVIYEGLNIVNPLVDIIDVDIKTQNYTMTSIRGEGQIRGDDAIPVLTKDGLQVVIDLTALYKLLPSVAPKIIKTIGVDFELKIIRPIIRSKIRDNAANYAAIDLYSTKREEFETQLRDAIELDFVARGFNLEQLLIRKINLPQSVKESIERKITADQEAQRMVYVLEKEKQEADRKRVEAHGIADAQKIINSGLSEKLLRFEQIKVQKELVNSPNSKIILLGNSKNSPPFIIGN